MGTAAFAVSEGVPQKCISESAHKWPVKFLSRRHRQTGTGTL